jgi:hypothetical protein
MSNQEYFNNKPLPSQVDPRFAPRSNVNFNYVWDSVLGQWIPMIQQEGQEGTLDQILNNTQRHIHKFGSHPNVPQNAAFDNQYTIWDEGTNYSFPSDSGQAMEVVSTHTSDNQSVFVEGLDENFQIKTEIVNLNGTTPVPLVGLWSRVFRAHNDGSTDFIGDVYVQNQVGAIKTHYAKILIGNNQTLMSVYTIPSEYIGYILKFSITATNVGSSSAIGFTINMLTREHGKVFRVLARTSAGTTYSIQEDYPFPLRLEPRTDILFNVVNANGNNGSVNCDFDIALV